MRHVLALLTVLAVALLLTLPALAADRAIIILDASGSMWAQIDGKTRIDLARDTLKQVLAGVPDSLELGFMAYGHRSKGDCNDIETLVEPAPGTAGAIADAAAGLSPKGKTPLSAAVKIAAEELQYTEDKATVILITDGIETCNADPCALATELASSGVDFRVDVVGLALSEEEGRQVRCLADNTHGKYLGADDAAGLQNALTDVVSEVTAPSEAPSSEAPVPDYNFAPQVVLTKGGDPFDNQEGVSFEFHSIKADGSMGDDVHDEFNSSVKATVDPGDYIVVARIGYAQASQKVTIENGKVASPLFDLEAGHLVVRPHLSTDSDVASNGEVDLKFSDGTSTSGYGELDYYVPAGAVNAAVTIGTASATDDFSIDAGADLTRDIVVGGGHAVLTASYVEGQPAADSTLFIDVFAAKKDIQGNRKEIGSGYGPTVEMDMAPGDYVAVATYDAAKAEAPFSIKAGEATSLDVSLNAGVLAVTAPDNADYTEVFGANKDIQGNRVSFGGTYDMTAVRTLPAGDYHVVVTLKNDAGTKEADATVTAGERTEITVQ